MKASEMMYGLISAKLDELNAEKLKMERRLEGKPLGVEEFESAPTLSDGEKQKLVSDIDRISTDIRFLNYVLGDYENIFSSTEDEYKLKISEATKTLADTQRTLDNCQLNYSRLISVKKILGLY